MENLFYFLSTYHTPSCILVLIGFWWEKVDCFVCLGNTWHWNVLIVFCLLRISLRFDFLGDVFSVFGFKEKCIGFLVCFCFLIQRENQCHWLWLVSVDRCAYVLPQACGSHAGERGWNVLPAGPHRHGNRCGRLVRGRQGSGLCCP